MESLNLGDTIDDQKRRIFDLSTMLEIGQTLLSSLSLKDVIDIVVLTCSGHFHSSDSIVLLSSEMRDPVFFQYETENGSISISCTDPFIQHLKEHPGAIQIDELKRRTALKKIYELFKKQGVDLIVPLKFKNNINGILCMKKKEEEFGLAYSAEERQYADIIAGFASVAIENARLYEMATLDRKTKMYNHGFFKNRLIEEIERSERYQTDLILMMLDLDHFKRVNDTYGHMTGDVVLVKVAETIKNHVRVYDIPARFGGEEFSVILPETESKDSLIVAERLRKQIGGLEFSTPKGLFHVTVSIGIARFIHGVNMTEDILIERADRALYHSKDSGRNRLALYDEITDIVSL